MCKIGRTRLLIYCHSIRFTGNMSDQPKDFCCVLTNETVIIGAVENGSEMLSNEQNRAFMSQILFIIY